MITFAFCFGKSMCPTIKSGTFVVIKSQVQYCLNDIVAVRGHNNKNYLHRIIDIDASYVTTKGDNQSIQPYENNVPIRHILGKLIFKFPK